VGPGDRGPNSCSLSPGGHHRAADRRGQGPGHHEPDGPEPPAGGGRRPVGGHPDLKRLAGLPLPQGGDGADLGATLGAPAGAGLARPITRTQQAAPCRGDGGTGFQPVIGSPV